MSLWSRLVRTVRRSGHDEDIDEELAFHLAMKAQAAGDPRAARLRFGNPDAVREQVREAGILVWLDAGLRDLRDAVRQLRRSWVVTSAVVASLVIGIGANAAIFSLVDAALLKSLPVADPAALQLVEWVSPGWPEALCESHTGNTEGDPTSHIQGSSISPLLYRELAARQTAAADLVGFSDTNDVVLTPPGRGGEEAPLQYVSANYFRALGVPPVRGRAIDASDDRVGQPVVVVISHRLWRRLFGGRPDAIGASLRVNGLTATVVGVAPPSFFGLSIGEWVDVYAPLAARVALTRSPDDPAPAAETTTFWWVRVMARLAPGREASALARQLTPTFQQLVVPPGVEMPSTRLPALVSAPARRGFDPIGDDERQALWILLHLVGLILLIVCANVANLLLARAVGRQREWAVRLALGAGRGRILRQQLLESGLLAAGGAVLGLWAGHLLAGAVDVLLRESTGARLDLRVDARLVLYTTALAAVAALLFGLAPALRAARADIQASLKAQGRSLMSGHLRLPRLLVAAQMGLCLTVLVAAGLLGRSLANLRLADVGFDRQRVLYASVNPWRAGMPASRVEPYLERLRQELAAIPGVRRVAAIGSRPLSGSSSMTSAHVPGGPGEDDPRSRVLRNELSDGAIEALGLRMLAGRSFDARDRQAASAAVVVNRWFVERFYAGKPPIGQRFRTGAVDGEPLEIVGVVSNSRYRSLRRDDGMPMVFVPLRAGDRAGRSIHLVIAMAVPVGTLATAIHEAARRVNPDVPVTELFTQSALIDRTLRTERLLSIASRAFGAVALVLAAIGLAGLLIYAVARRTSEIGLRMAMGAAPGDVARMVIRDSCWLVAGGILVGLPTAMVVSRLLRSTLVGVHAADPATTGTALAILGTVAMLAAWLPARRAAAIDPMAALREE